MMKQLKTSASQATQIGFLMAVGTLIPGALRAEVSWVSGVDGGWEVAANWLEKDSDPPVNRVPQDGEWIRPRAEGITITYSESTGLQNLGGSTIWQDASATTDFLQTGGDLTVNQLYLAKLKTNESGGRYTIRGGSLFVNRNMNMTWSNSGAIDSHFVQEGGSVRIGDGNNEGLWMCIKSSGQVATYDLMDGEFEAQIVSLCEGGSDSSGFFNQSSGTAVINQQLRLGTSAGMSGQAVYNLDGGELTITAAADPFLFIQPGGAVYFDFDGGVLNLRGEWDFGSLTAIENADFRVHGEPATEGDLSFEPILIEGETYTRIAISGGSTGEISAIIYDKDQDEITLTWTSRPGQVFGVSWSSDLEIFTMIPGEVPAEEGATETSFGPFANPVPGASPMFFRVGEPEE